MPDRFDEIERWATEAHNSKLPAIARVFAMQMMHDLADPATTLALIDLVRRARTAIIELEKIGKHFGEPQTLAACKAWRADYEKAAKGER